jgi:hypothetical protein
MIQNEAGLLTVVAFDARDSWDTVARLASRHLTGPGLLKLKRLLEGTVTCVAIERHYIDRDYRDTFSGYHSKKFVTPDSRTIRLHFFNAPFELAALRAKKLAEETYIGYSVIRPTRPNCLGRTLLDPLRIKGLVGTVCRCHEKISLQGTELGIDGFPFISQDTDATVCAESATWMVMRYFSNRYRTYREVHPFEITTATQNYANGERVYPSRGLHLWQMAETLRREGFSPVIYSRKGFEHDFDDLLYTYVESGFPVFAMLNGHVVVALGHHSDYQVKLPRRRQLKTSVFNRAFVINDDNNFPYQRIEAGRPRKRKLRNPLVSDYALSDVLAFAVPLPEKVFLAAEEFGSLVQSLLDSSDLAVARHSPILKKAWPLLVRQYLTTCRSFKQHLNERGMGSDLALEVYHDLPMPHFIWICELSSPSLYQTGQQKIWGEIIWDATRNAYEPAGFIAVHYPERLWVDLGSAINQPQHVIEWPIANPKPYPVLRSNLKEMES